MLYYSKIKAIKEEDNETQLLVTIDGNVQQKLMKYKTASGVDAILAIDDKRRITIKQMKKIYAMINDIAAHTGNAPEQLKEYFKYQYIALTGEEYFSLSFKSEKAASISTARDFITYLIDFTLIYDIPLSEPGYIRAEDIDRYLFSCIKYRKCCITGEKADIHHITGSRVGMGRNRKTIDHSELELIALNREWHTKVHQQGEKEIFEKFKIYGIKIDIETLDYLGLNYEDIS